jgi:hypothetical protein
VIRLVAFALGSALMAVALVVYAAHRRPPETSAPLYREDDDGWSTFV